MLKHAPQWQAVARDLGFSGNRVECVESDYIYLELKRCLHVIIWKWLHSKWKSNDGPGVNNPRTVIENVSHVNFFKLEGTKLKTLCD